MPMAVAMNPSVQAGSRSTSRLSRPQAQDGLEGVQYRREQDGKTHAHREDDHEATRGDQALQDPDAVPIEEPEAKAVDHSIKDDQREGPRPVGRPLPQVT